MTIKAIDFLNYYVPVEIAREYEQKRQHELVCKMEAAIGGPPTYSPEEMIRMMDEAGVERCFLAAWTMFSYWQKTVLVRIPVEEVAQVVAQYPDRFVGLAGYNPYRIRESLQEVERAIREYGFKGVYVHIYGWDIPLDDRRMYPLYAKCEELGVPVIMQVGYVLEAMPSEHGRPIMLDRIALDFPGLKLVGAHTGYPWCEELAAVCYKFDNVYFGVDAFMPRYLDPAVIRFMKGPGKDKVIWGTNGLPWKPVLKQIDELGLSEEVKRKLLRENAARVFGL